MKKLIFSIVMAMSLTAFAQTSTTQLPNSNSSAPSATTSEPSATTVNTLSTTATQAAPAGKSKFAGSFAMSAFAMVNDVKDNGSKALIDSENSLGLNYAVTEKMKVGISHNFGMRSISDRSQLADFESDNGAESPYKTLDPTIHLNYKMGTLLGSNEYSLLSRYYVPVSQKSQTNKSAGTLRSQVWITWPVNTKIDVSLMGQARLYMNTAQNKDEARGSDSVLRTILGPNFAYNFNDSVNAYYSPYLDLRSVGFQRAQYNADTANNFNHELGVWITLAGGKYIVNPAWATSSSKLGLDSYDGTGSDSNSEYDLNLIAYF
jgi:hypothetical protein